MHLKTILSRLANCCKECSISSLFFNYTLRNVTSSCNSFIKRSEFSIKMSLPQEFKCLSLKESTADKNKYFRASNSSITECLDFHSSSLAMTVNDSLHCP